MVEISTSLVTAWVIGVVGAAFAIVAGHLAITKLYPALKDVLASSIKEEKALSGLMYLLVAYTVIFVLQEVVQSILSINNTYLNIISLLNPPLQLLLNLLWYISWLVVGFFFMYGLRRK